MKDENINNNSEIIIYRTNDGKTKIDVRLTDNSVWLNQNDMVELFQSSKSNISEHIKHIFDDMELEENSVVRNFRTTANDNKTYSTNYYNLDVIISVGYRVKSQRGVQFRIWATERLREYLIKGFTMNDDLLKQSGGGGYFEELLNRIRDIRSSEKVFYRKVLEIYATSVDYDPKAESTKIFFQTVQNKLHWAAHGHTAAEIIFERSDSEKPFMGLTTFKGSKPSRSEITTAKNYLTEEELSVLNRLVSAYLDIAEVNAIQRKVMTMQNWIHILDGFITMSRQDVLTSAGKISADLAEKKAQSEYEKYRENNIEELSEVEKHFFDSINSANKKISNKDRRKL